MNVFWTHNGKKLTIIWTLLIVGALFEIFITTNTLQAALFGSMIPIMGFITIKAAMGWSLTRYWNRQRKERNSLLR